MRSGLVVWPRIRKLACRAVLILTEVLILLMPLTEHFCKWDKLLRGGPDVEFGLLSLLLFAGLVLLTAYRQVTSPFLVLLACWVIALPLAISGNIPPFVPVLPLPPDAMQLGPSSRFLPPGNTPPDLIPSLSSIVSASPGR